MTNFVNKFKKRNFWPIVGPFFQFWGQKQIFQENLARSRTTSHGFLALHQNLGKTNDTIPRKRPDRWTEIRKSGPKDGRTDGKTLFYGAPPATPGGPKIKQIYKIIPDKYKPIMMSTKISYGENFDISHTWVTALYANH